MAMEPSDQERADLPHNTRVYLEWLEAECAAPSWQPISTAPKDGTEINGYRPDQGVFTFRWADESEFCGHEFESDTAEDCEEFSWWWHDRWGWMEGELTPTHWMPLPAPPEAG